MNHKCEHNKENNNHDLREYVCYCNRVTEEDIIRAVEKGNKTVKEVIMTTGAMKNSNCIENNPKKE